MSNDTPPTGPAESARPRVLLWPLLVIGLLAGHALAITFVLLIATRDQSFSTEPDYYQKALNWDETAAQRATNEKLGWQVELTLDDKIGPIGERVLRCALRDATGAAVADAQVSVTAFPHARGQQRVSTELHETPDGRYASSVRFHRKGLWEFRLTARRGDDTFTYTEQRDVYPPGESRPWRR